MPTLARELGAGAGDMLNAGLGEAVEGGDEVASTRRSSPGLSRPRPAVPESRPSREDARETVREAGPGLHTRDSGQISAYMNIQNID